MRSSSLLSFIDIVENWPKENSAPPIGIQSVVEIWSCRKLSTSEQTRVPAGCWETPGARLSSAIIGDGGTSANSLRTGLIFSFFSSLFFFCGAFSRKVVSGKGLKHQNEILRVAQKTQKRAAQEELPELFIRNEKILSPDSEISWNFHFFAFFLQVSTNLDIFAHICEIPRNVYQHLEVK